MTHTPPYRVTHPYAQQWAEASETVNRLISQVEQALERIQTSRRNLNWRGGSERYFQWQVGRQYSYLSRQLVHLQQLRTLMTQAAEAPATVATALGGAS